MAERTYTRKELEEVAGQAGGAAAGAFMFEDPALVMPSREVAAAVDRVLDAYDRENPTAEELCELAWGIIANAHGGDWEQASEGWQDAAARWRDGWHRLLERIASPSESAV